MKVILSVAFTFLSFSAFASVMPEHVTCEVIGTVERKFSTEHIDRFMGGEEKRTTHDVEVKILSSEVSADAMEGKCPDLGSLSTFSFKEVWNRFKFKKGDCISATTKRSGSTTFSANWIYEIEKLPVENCTE